MNITDDVSETHDEEWSSIPPRILARLRETLLAFLTGVPDMQAGTFIEELKGFTDAVRVDQSDTPEAELMLWWLQGFSMQVDTDSWRVYGPAEDDIPPSVDYLRRSADGVWWLWYPGDPWDDDKALESDEI